VNKQPSKFVAFFNKTAVKAAYIAIVLPLAIFMFYVATDSGSLFDYMIVVLALWFVIVDAIELTKRFKAYRLKRKASDGEQ